MNTKPEVYVIESLDPDDEGNGRFEGVIISRMLELHGKRCKYEYVRTRQQFESAAKRFGKSRYRYLHIRPTRIQTGCALPIGMISTFKSLEIYCVPI